MPSTTTTIFKATYSGVACYEMPCKGIAVMRRRRDSWMNATQILKVAGFDKPQRTRILEREVQKGLHEKIQGGYGKYQGTWVPLERGLELSLQYGVDHLLSPLTSYQPAPNDSPPLAPKHITAPSTRTKISKAAAAVKAQALAISASLPPSSGRRTNNSRSNFDDAHHFSLALVPRQSTSNDHPPSATQQVQSSSTCYPKPNNKTSTLPLLPPASAADDGLTTDLDRPSNSSQDPHNRPSPVPVIMSHKDHPPYPVPLTTTHDHDDDPPPPSPPPQQFQGDHRSLILKRSYDDSSLGPPPHQHDSSYPPDPIEEAYVDDFAHSPTAAKYAKAILDYFVSEAPLVPNFLINPPADFDPNVMIDDDGHTALHWACAMGRTQVVKLLLDCGADIFRANHVGQTALMRAVMFTNNYDLRTFGELFEGFRQSVINIDRNDRTVFHYVIDIALQKGKINAARYYLETILDRLKDYRKEIADILNFQDDDGETALTLAVRSRSKRLVKTLLEHGANIKVANREGKSAEDYILADDKFRGLETASYRGHVEPHSEDTQASISALNAINLAPTTSNTTVTLGSLLATNNNSGPTCTTNTTDNHHVAYHPQVIISQTGQKVMDQFMPQMIEMIEQVSKSFDNSLNEKEADLHQANALLSSIQNELSDGQSKLEGLRNLTQESGQKRAQLAELESELGEKMGKRCRFGWEKYIRDEEERVKKFDDSRASLVQQLRDVDLVASQGFQPSPPQQQQQQQQLALKLRELEDDNRDLLALASLPLDVEAECERLRSNLANLRDERAGLFKEYIDLASENVPGDQSATSRLNDYRRLISLGCGGIGLDEVDEVIDSLSDSIMFPSSTNLGPPVIGPSTIATTTSTSAPSGASLVAAAAIANNHNNGSQDANSARLGDGLSQTSFYSILN